MAKIVAREHFYATMKRSSELTTTKNDSVTSEQRKKLDQLAAAIVIALALIITVFVLLIQTSYDQKLADMDCAEYAKWCGWGEE